MDNLESRIENVPTIFNLSYFLIYYYNSAFKDKINTYNSFTRDVALLISLVRGFYFKNGHCEFPPAETPLPELMRPIYNRIINYIIKSN